MTPPTLYLLIGFPGAGKTTVANYISEATQAVHLWADQERARMFANPSHSPQESRELYEYMNHKAEALLQSGQSVVFDTSFNFYKDRQRLRQIAQNAGAEVVLVHVTTDKAIAKARATHGDHAERNGMPFAMSEATFERIASHLEPLHDDETAIEIDCANTPKDSALKILGLQ